MSTRLGLSPVVLGLATLVIVSWLSQLCWLAFFHTPDNELWWSRHFILLRSVETVALAAASALFGTQVHKQRADEANERASKAEDAATKGKMLAMAVKAEANVEREAMKGQSFARAGSESLKLAEQIVS